MTAPITIITGMGRCGSSMVMQMLVAGGVEVTGDAVPPLWEDPRCAEMPVNHDMLQEARGRAVKILTPHRYDLPTDAGHDYRWIWLDRNKREQERSQHKMAAWMGRARLPFSIPVWRAKGLDAIRRIGGDLLILEYERILAYPVRAAVAIAAHIGRDDLNPAAMAAVVRKRDGRCLDHMAEGVFIPD